MQRRYAFVVNDHIRATRMRLLVTLTAGVLLLSIAWAPMVLLWMRKPEARRRKEDGGVKSSTRDDKDSGIDLVVISGWLEWVYSTIIERAAMVGAGIAGWIAVWRTIRGREYRKGDRNN